jgi:hypothetical protein
LLIFAAFPTVLLGGRTFVIRDFGLFGYPLAYFHRESFWRGELPLWNPLNHCGLPFLAQWNTLTLYPCSAIYLFLPLTWSLPFFCLAHMFWGGLGMYFLAWEWTRHRFASALAGIVFAFNGLTLNALMWPNIESALSWLPWLLWLAPRGWRDGGRTLVWAVLAGAMQMLTGGPEPVLFTWLILLALVGADWFGRPALRIWILFRFLALGALVALICAIQLLPFLQLLAHSQRDAGFGATSHNWSIPFWGWANFFVPLFRTCPTAQGVYFQTEQNWTSSYYAGIGTVFLAGVAVWRQRSGKVWLLAALALLGAVLAMGDMTLLYLAMRAFLPGIGLLRYPVKAVILVLALAPLLAALGVAALADNSRRVGRFEFSLGLVLLLVIFGIVACGWDSCAPADAWRSTWHNGLTRAGFLALIVLIGGALLRAPGQWRTPLGILFLVAFWLDLATHVPNQNPTAQPFIYAPGLADARLKWHPQPCLGSSRVMLAPDALQTLRFNPLPSLEQTFLQNRQAARPDCNLLDGIPQIDGFFSLVPRQIARVSALPYEQPQRPFPALLDFMGVSQITVPGSRCIWAPRATAMPLVTAGQEPIFAEDSAALEALGTTNLDLRRMVYLPADARAVVSARSEPSAHVHVSEFAAQNISLQTTSSAPCIVVIAQSYYPAWKAYVDGRATKTWRANYAFQAIEVPAGQHQLRLRYEDTMLWAGAVLSAVGLLGCSGLWLSARSSRQKKGESVE